MNAFPTAEETVEKFNERVEETYDLCDSSKNILSHAIEKAISNNSRKVELVVGAYWIEEWRWWVRKFLESNWYENIEIEESGYTCFDNNRGKTEISFTF